MFSGLIRLVSRIKWWLGKSKKMKCHYCCVFCEFYDLCSDDPATKTVIGEVVEW